MLYLICLSRTYEELKLYLRKRRRKAKRVYRVPMRNWNGLIEIESNNGDKVYRVPMRNWNYFILYFYSFLKNVYRVPMRNWNNNLLSLIYYFSF